MGKFTIFVEKHERPYGERERRVIDRVQVATARAAARRAVSALKTPGGMHESKPEARRTWVLDARGREVMTCKASRGRRATIAQCKITQKAFKAAIKRRK